MMRRRSNVRELVEPRQLPDGFVVGKGHHQEKAGEDREQEKIVLLGIVQRHLVNRIEPSQPGPLPPSPQAGEGFSQESVHSSQRQPKPTLGHGGSKQKLPEAGRGEAGRISSEHPVQEGSPASGKPHDVEGFPDLHLPVAPKEDLVQEEPHPVDHLENQEEGNEEEEEPQPPDVPGPRGPFGDEGQAKESENQHETIAPTISKILIR
jgi:hypothetical protein